MTPRGSEALGAVDVLLHQHRQITALFDQLEATASPAQRQRLFEALADALAVHAALEERHFYPTLRALHAEQLLTGAFDDHPGIKRVLATLLGRWAGDDAFEARLCELRERVELHIEDEEAAIFPQVRALLDRETLEAMADDLVAAQAELERRGDPRRAIAQQVMQPPELVSLR